MNFNLEIKDDLEDINEQKYINNMDEMLHDIGAYTFIDVTSDGINPSIRPHRPGPTANPSYDKLLDDAQRPLFIGCTNYFKL